MCLGFLDKNSFQTKTAEETAFGLNGLSSDRCCIEILLQAQKGQHVRKSQQRHRTCLCVCVVKGAFISERDCAFGDLLVGLFVRFVFVVSFCFGEKVQYTNAK